MTEVGPAIDAGGSGRHAMAPWRHIAASQTGTAHLRTALPCQDRYRCEVIASAHGPVLLVVVADGAGSASESRRGAEVACARLIDGLRLGIDHVAPDTAGAWLRDSIEHARTAVLREAEVMELPPRELASTLACAVIAEEWSVFAQIGDGAIVRRATASQEWSPAFWPQRGEYANMTSFLTDAGAMDVLEMAVEHQTFPEIAAFTDGLQDLILDTRLRIANGPWFDRMFRSVRKSAADGEDDVLNDGLRAYLGSEPVVCRTDDDLTLVLASRVAAGEDDGVRPL